MIKNLCIWPLFAVFPLVLILSSCFALPLEEPVPPPPIIKSVESAVYKTVAVERGDVSLFRNFNAQYVSAREESLSFALNDVYIKTIHVDVGDFVHKGDIVAELDRDAFLTDWEHALQEESWVRLSLSQLEERRRLALLSAEISGIPLDEASYLDERDALMAQQQMLDIRKANLEFELERRVLRAGMDGSITYVMSFREGDTSTADQRVVTVADQTQSVFMVRGSGSELLETGGIYDLTVDGETYNAQVTAPDTLGVSRAADDEVYLVILDEEQPLFSSRTYATLYLVMDEVKDALYVPVSAVKKANARVFVYVLTDGVRRVRDIVPGLAGTVLTEVKSGLDEGELVIVD